MNKPRYTMQVQNNVKRKGGAFKGTKLSQMMPRNDMSKNYNATTGQAVNNSQGRIPITRNGPNIINAIPNKLANTFHNDVSFNRSFANTQMKMYNHDASSLETLGMGGGGAPGDTLTNKDYSNVVDCLFNDS